MNGLGASNVVAVRPGREQVGRVVANTGSDLLVMVDARDGERPQLRNGDILLVGSQGAQFVGVVSGVNAPAPGLESESADLWIAQVELRGRFSTDPGQPAVTRSADGTPSLGDPAFQTNKEDLQRLYRNADASAYGIGQVVGQEGIEATFDPEALATGGFAILGASGSGKSCTMAVIARALVRHRYAARTLLIDPYNEFSHSFGKAATIIRPRPGLFPHWLLTFEEIVWALSRNGGPLDQEEYSILEEAIPAARQRFVQRTTVSRVGERSDLDAVSVDGPIPYRITDLIGFIDKNTLTDEARSGTAYRRLRVRITATLTDPRLSVIFGSAAANDTLPTLITRLFAMDPGSPPAAVLQLGELSADLDKLIVSVVCRLAAAVAACSDNPHKTLVLIEDASRYAPPEPSDGATSLSSDALLTLCGRARKLGTVIGFTANHPRSVNRELMSACATFFLHRIPSALDADIIEDLLPEAAPAALTGLGTLGDRVAIGIGSAVPISGPIQLTSLPSTAVPGEASRLSANGAGRNDDVESIVHRWRYGSPGAPVPAE